MRISIPLVSDLERVRKGYLVSVLDSLARNSTERHDIVIVSQDGEDPAFQNAVAQYSPRIITVREPFRYPNETTRLYEWLNAGARAAETEWIMAPVGDDSYFFTDWEQLLNELDPTRLVVWTPQIFETAPAREFLEQHPRSAERRVGWPEPTMAESKLLELVKSCQSVGVLEERPNDRVLAHWAHTVQHRDLFWRVGGFIEQPPWPNAHDLHLQDAYAALGITKRCVTSAVIGNCQIPVTR